MSVRNRRELARLVLKVLRDQAWGAIAVLIALLALLRFSPVQSFLVLIGQPTPTPIVVIETPTAVSGDTATPVIPTPTPAIPTPTSTLAPLPTPTVLQYAVAGSRGENVTLQGDCNDPITVTVTQIDVEPAQGDMVWSLTLYNNSQATWETSCNDFTLQEGQQTNHTFTATGDLFGPGVDISPGQTMSTTMSFSFVPYQGEPYSLASGLFLIAGLTTLPVNFDAVSFTF